MSNKKGNIIYWLFGKKTIFCITYSVKSCLKKMSKDILS